MLLYQFWRLASFGLSRHLTCERRIVLLDNLLLIRLRLRKWTAGILAVWGEGSVGVAMIDSCRYWTSCILQLPVFSCSLKILGNKWWMRLRIWINHKLLTLHVLWIRQHLLGRHVLHLILLSVEFLLLHMHMVLLHLLVSVHIYRRNTSSVHFDFLIQLIIHLHF